MVSSISGAPGPLTSRPISSTLIAGGVAAAVLAGSLALLSHGGFMPPGARAGDLNWLTGLVAAASALPIVAWRRAPLGVFAATAAASILLAGLGSSLGLPPGPTAALYLLAASRDERRPWTRATTLVVCGLLVGYLSATTLALGQVPGTAFSHTVLAWAVAWFAGERSRLRHQHVAELHQRVLHAERDAELERQLATARERARIARDLHDSAGHAINVIVVRAGAARMRHHEDPRRSLAALATIEEIARQTAADIDQMVGALRDRAPDAAVDSPPGLASLHTLIAHHGAAGFDVTVATVGSPRALGSAVDQAAYRILQEALTNASRHGSGAASVDLTFAETALELKVTNPVVGAGAQTPSRGHGLVGMGERATLVGGNFGHECTRGAFQLRAQLPYARSRP